MTIIRQLSSWQIIFSSYNSSWVENKAGKEAGMYYVFTRSQVLHTCNPMETLQGKNLSLLFFYLKKQTKKGKKKKKKSKAITKQDKPWAIKL